MTPGTAESVTNPPFSPLGRLAHLVAPELRASYERVTGLM